jgi:hypothetical protein
LPAVVFTSTPMALEVFSLEMPPRFCRKLLVSIVTAGDAALISTPPPA